MASSIKSQAHKKSKFVRERYIPGIPLLTNISFMGSQIGKVQEIGFVDYDVNDPIQFHELFFPNYPQVITSVDGKPLVLTKEWGKPL
jgi:hypothetical protein